METVSHCVLQMAGGAGVSFLPTAASAVPGLSVLVIAVSYNVVLEEGVLLPKTNV